METDYSESSQEQSTTPHHSLVALLTFLGVSHSVVVYFGGFLLHIWTTYLFFTHWGVFFGFIAFFCPPLSELVALGCCFWWGTWYYILAIAAFLTGTLSFGLAEAFSERAVKWLLASGLVTYILLASFGFFAIRTAIEPRRLSENDRKEAEDVSLATFAVLKNCSSRDPTVLAGLTEAKDRIRRRVDGYDNLRKEEVVRNVNVYLRAYALTARDCKDYLLFNESPDQRFVLSDETQRAIDSLPKAIRPTTIEVETEAKGLLRQIPKGTSRREIETAIRPTEQREWQLMGDTYKNLLGAPMPERAELLHPSK